MEIINSKKFDLSRSVTFCSAYTLIFLALANGDGQLYSFPVTLFTQYVHEQIATATFPSGTEFYNCHSVMEKICTSEL